MKSIQKCLPVSRALRVPENRITFQGTARLASLLDWPQQTSLSADPEKCSDFRRVLMGAKPCGLHGQISPSGPTAKVQSNRGEFAGTRIQEQASGTRLLRPRFGCAFDDTRAWGEAVLVTFAASKVTRTRGTIKLQSAASTQACETIARKGIS